MHIVVFPEYEYSNRRQINHITAKVDLISGIKGTSRRREGQPKVGVDHGDCTGQQSKSSEAHPDF
jgi:hypothetical protein